MQKLKFETKNIVKENVEKFSQIFPNVVKEGKVDFEALKQMLSDCLIDGCKERYGLNWVGKKESILKSGLVSIGTTEFVLNDKNADLKGIVEQIDENVPIFASKFDYDKSELDGLKSYCKGSVKEGVGAGGISVYSYANGLNPNKVRKYVEKNYYKWFNVDE